MTSVQERILAWYMQAFPEKLPGPRHVGPEEEYIVVDKNGHRGDSTPLFHDLVADGWKPRHDPVTKELVGVSMGDLEVGMDVGAGTLEIGFIHTENLLTHLPTRAMVLKFVDLHLERRGLYRLKDYAAQPITEPVFEHWGPKGRSHFFREYFPRDVDVQTASAASQVHIDLALGEIIPVLQMLLSLSPIFTALTANAPIWGGRVDPLGMLASRQDFWNRFTLFTGHWSNVHVGRPQAQPPYLEQIPASLEELAWWISRTRFLVHVQNGQIVAPTGTFADWYENGGKDLSEEAQRAAYMSHEGTLWWEARPRITYGTIEVRPCCQSKYAVNMDALILGLIENWEATLGYVKREKSFNAWRAWHIPCLKDGLRVEGVKEVARHVLDLAGDGLRRRGFAEEHILAALILPIETSTSPGHEKRRIYENHGMETLIEYLLSKQR